jgi:hypothetical protein
MTPTAIASHPAGHDPQPPPGTRDRWVLWPAVTAVVTVSALTFLCGLPGQISFTLIPISLLVYLVATMTIFVSAAVSLIRRRRRQSASAILALIVPILLWTPIGWTTDCMHLCLTTEFGLGVLNFDQVRRGSLIDSIHTPSTSDKPFQVYDWSVGLAGGPNTFLIRDITGEIALPLPQHRFPLTLENGFGEVCAGRVRHLIGHYYVCDF